MSTLSNKVDVLVVGAGPCGLAAALELSKAGLEVEIVDRAWRSSAQSYACGLHSSTVEILRHLGLERPALDAGLTIDSVGFYSGTDRMAELRFGDMPNGSPFLLVLPQDRLEEILEQELHRRGIRVRWGHRLDDLRQDDNAVHATVEKLGMTSVGYPFARSEETVESATEVRARYLVGADGHASHVRSLLNLEVTRIAAPAEFEVFEYTPAVPASSEVRVAVGPDTMDAFWPQPGSVGRWSLETSPSDPQRPSDGTEGFVVLDAGHDRDEIERLEERLRKRAPWYTAGVKEIDWTTRVTFEPRAVQEFGRDRCWLVGDAAHQTRPVGMQSMNVGLRESLDLSRRIAQILRQGASPDLLLAYHRERRAEWQVLLGTGGGLRPSPTCSAWVRDHASRLLSCLPGSGSELPRLAQQLGLDLG